ncbi:MAG: GH3 auxin-responsive promoter family protein [Candidatus Peribacteria bacterium]|nr:GH3 auxin-responsive promoter family protein [Candidatus Peribacteria bacterium]
MEKILQTTQHQNITAIAGIPLWCEHLLKEVIRRSHKQNIHEIRPAFEAFFTGGTRYAPYQHAFNKLWDKNKVQVWQSYNASEGFFAIQTEKNADDMLLLTNQCVFYELIPLTDYHATLQSGKPISSLGTATIPLSEAELGKEYVVVITTDAGLWRYIIGDTLQFTSLSPYKIQITGRTTFFIDAFNEHTLLYHTNAAIRQLESRCLCKVKEYTVGANIDEKRYEWIIEFSHMPKGNLEHIETIVDEALQEANDNYRAKRIDTGGIQKNKIHIGKS